MACDGGESWAYPTTRHDTGEGLRASLRSLAGRRYVVSEQWRSTCAYRVAGDLKLRAPPPRYATVRLAGRRQRPLARANGAQRAQKPSGPAVRLKSTLTVLSRFRRKIDDFCRWAVALRLWNLARRSVSSYRGPHRVLERSAPLRDAREVLQRVFDALSVGRRYVVSARTGGSTTTRTRARSKYNLRTTAQAHNAPFRCLESDRFLPPIKHPSRQNTR